MTIRRRRLDQHWRRSLGFSMALIGLVIVGIGADWTFAISALLTCLVGLGFFYLLFPHGMHFGITVANLLAFYACLFDFFHEADYAEAPPLFVDLAFLLPMIAFLGSCFIRRRRIVRIIAMRRTAMLLHWPRLTRWVPGVMAIGAVSFALPAIGLDRTGQGVVLVAAMAGIGFFVAFAISDVVLLLMDIAIVFEEVSARLKRMLMPVMAFLTLYCLIVVVFGCLYRILDRVTEHPQFLVHGVPAPLGFTEAMFFSVVTLSTLGYGDIVPATSLVRVLSAAEVVTGILMLLFGFSEIMRTGPAGRD